MLDYVPDADLFLTLSEKEGELIFGDYLLHHLETLNHDGLIILSSGSPAQIVAFRERSIAIADVKTVGKVSVLPVPAEDGLRIPA
ncbi:hypothetical protein [Halioglobus sp. HI00S01]|uniref:hypothetical protein n=1 Tax=Halioglobus sp. HI00S01 TaxID=1822214 RepID=UPI0012E9480D|nr:hypothetical protein [Halioglobus sp. HI00S01]